MEDPEPSKRTGEKLFNILKEKLTGWTVTKDEQGKISVDSVRVSVECPANDQHKIIYVSWTNQDEEIGAYILGLLQNMG